MKRHHGFLPMAAASHEDMERVAREMHEDRHPNWHSRVLDNTHPADIAGAEARGLKAFTVERWWEA